jgi:hypothetical protein
MSIHTQSLEAIEAQLLALSEEEIRDFLDHLESALDARQRRHPTVGTAESAYGLLATGASVPSDAEVTEWIEERRKTKYA